MKNSKKLNHSEKNITDTWINEMYKILVASKEQEVSLKKKVEEQINKCYAIENNLQTESMLFLLDNSSMKYLFVSESVVNVLGYSKNEIIENGLQWIFTLLSPRELIYKTELMKDIYDFLKTLDRNTLLSCIVRYDIVAYKKDGEPIHLMEELMFPIINNKNETLITSCFIHVLDNYGYINERKCTILQSTKTQRQALFSKTYSVELPSILSARETEVLEKFSNGLTTTQVANQLFVSENTIKSHRKNIILKLKVQNTAEAIKVSMNGIRHK